jgi:hypothetical protein
MRIEVSDAERETFVTALRTINAAGIPYVIAGAFCVHFYTGIWRYTKDMDVFARPEDTRRALDALAAAGFKTWVEAEHWLGKATRNGSLIDVIFGSGNWLAPIDAIWFERSKPAELFGEPVHMAPIEEMIWTKCYIGGRERFDGADVAHLLMASGGNLYWQHLLSRFGEHWQLLLGHLNWYAFIYPSNLAHIPQWVLDELHDRVRRQRQQPAPARRLCRGTLLDRFSFNYDVEHLGYIDAREYYAKAQGGTVQDVAVEREWARDKLAKGEVYKERA